MNEKLKPCPLGEAGEFVKKIAGYFKIDMDKTPDEPLIQSEKLLLEACNIIGCLEKEKNAVYARLKKIGDENSRRLVEIMRLQAQLAAKDREVTE